MDIITHSTSEFLPRGDPMVSEYPSGTMILSEFEIDEYSELSLVINPGISLFDEWVRNTDVSEMERILIENFGSSFAEFNDQYQNMIISEADLEDEPENVFDFVDIEN